MAADHCEWYNGSASEDSRAEGPSAGEWVDHWADEKEGDYDVGKREPIRAVGEPRVIGIGVFESTPDGYDPERKPAASFGRLRSARAEPMSEYPQFVQKRESRDPADHQPRNEEKHHGSESKQGRRGAHTGEEVT